MNLLLAQLAVVCSLLCEGAVVRFGSQQQKLFLYQKKLEIVDQFLASECPDYVKVKRQQVDSLIPLHIEVAEGVYNHLIKQLLLCRSETTNSATLSVSTTTMSTLSTTTVTTPNSTISTSSATTVNSTLSTTPATKVNSTLSTTPASATTSTLSTTPATRVNSTISITPASATNSTLYTTSGSIKPTMVSPSTQPTPEECLEATNLTESWRMDYNGSKIRPGGPHAYTEGEACDFHVDLQWFRFTGGAGNMMLNKCPPFDSCGTLIPYWTSDNAPVQVGVAATIAAQGSASTNGFGIDCKFFPTQIEVMRCSLRAVPDLIYRYVDKGSHSDRYFDKCNTAFCGMKL